MGKCNKNAQFAIAWTTVGISLYKGGVGGWKNGETILFLAFGIRRIKSKLIC